MGLMKEEGRVRAFVLVCSFPLDDKHQHVFMVGDQSARLVRCRQEPLARTYTRKDAQFSQNVVTTMYMAQIESDGFTQIVCTAKRKAVCFICGSRKGCVINFNTAESVINCRNLLEARQDRKLKFSDILIPLEVNHYDGYHKKCYDEFANLEEPSPSAEAATAGPSTSKSSSEQAESVGSKLGEKRKFQDVTSKQKDVVTSKSDNSSLEDGSEIENCFFCGQKDVDGKEEKLCKMTKSAYKKLQYHAEVIGNADMYEKFEEVMYEDLEEGRLRFHNICRRQFEHNSNAVKTMSQKKPVSYTEDEKMTIVYSDLCSYVQERIVKKRHCISLSSLGRHYKNRFDKRFKKSTEYPEDLFIKNDIENKLLDTFKDQLNVVSKEGFRILTSDGFKITDGTLEKLRELEILEKAAHILREDIANVKSDRRTIDNITTDFLITKFALPKSLQDFHETLLTGMSRRKNKSSRCIRLTDSFSQDLIYAVSKGQLTQKHMSIAITLKGFASSIGRAKQMINTLNRYGHCCSYTTLKKMERKFDWSEDESDDEEYNRSDPGSDYDI